MVIVETSFPTFASALKRVALTPGVLAIFWPTAAKMLQFGITATWKSLFIQYDL